MISTTQEFWLIFWSVNALLVYVRILHAHKDGISERVYGDDGEGNYFQVGWWPWHIVTWLGSDVPGVALELFFLWGWTQVNGPLEPHQFVNVFYLALAIGAVHYALHTTIYEWTRGMRWRYMEPVDAKKQKFRDDLKDYINRYTQRQELAMVIGASEVLQEIQAMHKNDDAANRDMIFFHGGLQFMIDTLKADLRATDGAPGQ